MTIRVHRGDLPDLSRYQVPAVAVDTEAMGLALGRDRLCVVQLSPGDSCTTHSRSRWRSSPMVSVSIAIAPV